MATPEYVRGRRVRYWVPDPENKCAIPEYEDEPPRGVVALGLGPFTRRIFAEQYAVLRRWSNLMDRPEECDWCPLDEDPRTYPKDEAKMARRKSAKTLAAEWKRAEQARIEALVNGGRTVDPAAIEQAFSDLYRLKGCCAPQVRLFHTYQAYALHVMGLVIEGRDFHFNNNMFNDIRNPRHSVDWTAVPREPWYDIVPTRSWDRGARNWLSQVSGSECRFWFTVGRALDQIYTEMQGPINGQSREADFLALLRTKAVADMWRAGADVCIMYHDLVCVLVCKHQEGVRYHDTSNDPDYCGTCCADRRPNGRCNCAVCDTCGSEASDFCINCSVEGDYRDDGRRDVLCRDCCSCCRTCGSEAGGCTQRQCANDRSRRHGNGRCTVRSCDMSVFCPSCGYCSNCGHHGHCDTQLDRVHSIREESDGSHLIAGKRGVGLEIEYNACARFRHLAKWCQRWKAGHHSDGSCGWEIVTPPIAGENIDRCLSDLNVAFTEAQTRADARCGVHVHVDARDFHWSDIYRLLDVYSTLEPLLYLLGGQQRARNRYCKPCGPQYREAVRNTTGIDRKYEVFAIAYEVGGRKGQDSRKSRGDEQDRLQEKKHSGRYKGLNICPWLAGRKREGRKVKSDATIEFRLHESTLDMTRLAHWAHLLERILTWCKTHTDADVRKLPKTPLRAIGIVAPKSLPWILSMVKAWRAAKTKMKAGPLKKAIVEHINRAGRYSFRLDQFNSTEEALQWATDNGIPFSASREIRIAPEGWSLPHAHALGVS